MWVLSHLPWSDQPGTADCPALLRLSADDLAGDESADVARQNITATDRQVSGSDVHSADTADPLVSNRYLLYLNKQPISNLKFNVDSISTL